MFSADAYTRQLRSLFPAGRAWAGAETGRLGELISAIAQEMARVDDRASQLIDESDPSTTLELLPDWESAFGLPDACFGQPDNIAERQAAVLARMTNIGGQSRAYFIELAASLGYVVTIDEFPLTRCGDRCGSRTYGEDWVHAWRMNVLPTDYDVPDQQIIISQARCGDRCGRRIRGWGSLDLECLVSRHRPAHSIVLFSYQIEPEALFWIDFTA